MVQDQANRKPYLLGVLSLTGFVTSFGAYIVAANLPAYSKETGAGLIMIGFIGQSTGLGYAFRFVGVVGVGSLICLSFLRERKVADVERAGVSC